MSIFIKWQNLLRSVATLSFCCVEFLVIQKPIQGFDLLPYDARGIRLIPPLEEPILLDFLAVKGGTEDRTVLEYDVGQLDLEQIDSVKLIIEAGNIDEGGEPGFIDVFTFNGDGIVSQNDFFAGSFFTTFEASNYLNIVSVDVTDLVTNTIAMGNPFLGFRLSTTTTDRYWICDGAIWDYYATNCLLDTQDPCRNCIVHGLHNGTELGPPRLSVVSPTSVPEPTSSASLFAFGLFNIGLLYQRMKKS